MSQELTREQLQKYREEFDANPNNKVFQNTISANDIRKLAVNREQEAIDQHTFSKQTEPRVNVTNQKSSGRCWMFAALNIMRREMIKKYNLSPDFELSQSYLFFWDKLERLNYNLECIIKTSNEPVDSRVVSKIMEDPVADGGQWDMFVNLVRKYGVVPKSVFGESHHSSNSGVMNSLFKMKFRQAALQIRELMRKPDGEVKAREYKEQFNQFMYNTLSKMIGTPPTNFTWEYTNKDKEYHRLEVESPQKFFEEQVPFNLDDYVCVINDPRSGHDYYKLYTVQYLGNIEGGQPVKYLNVPMEDMKSITLKSLKGDDAVWFGCDVGKERIDELMSVNIKEYGNLFNTSFAMSREDRLNSGESQMTHAMVFSGFNSYEVDGKEVVNRWEVENSWGKRGDHGGYYTMTDEWYDMYMYEVVVKKEYVTPEMTNALEQEDMTVLPLWDPMGALAERGIKRRRLN